MIGSSRPPALERRRMRSSSPPCHLQHTRCGVASVVHGAPRSPRHRRDTAEIPPRYSRQKGDSRTRCGVASVVHGAPNELGSEPLVCGSARHGQNMAPRWPMKRWLSPQSHSLHTSRTTCAWSAHGAPRCRGVAVRRAPNARGAVRCVRGCGCPLRTHVGVVVRDEPVHRVVGRPQQVGVARLEDAHRHVRVEELHEDHLRTVHACHART